VLDQPNLDNRCFRGIASQCMFWMLNLAYISRSSDFEIFLTHINLIFIFLKLVIDLCFEINLQIILSKSKQVRNMILRNSYSKPM